MKLLHDNKFNYKTKNRKFKTNKIKGIVKVIKEMQKKGDFIGLRKLIHKHKIENWYIFLKNFKS